MSELTTSVVAGLAASPLYQLSTAGQELFHSNMLYWLIKEQPAASVPVMEYFKTDAIAGWPELAEVRREWMNLDLAVFGGTAGRNLVLENKLHSIPNRQQLVDYHAGCTAIFDEGKTSFILLTLIRPGFDVPKPWRHVDYSELLVPLAASAKVLRENDQEFDALLVENYVELVRLLVGLRDSFAISETGSEPLHLSVDAREELRGARLLPLVEKLRIAGMASTIEMLMRSSVTVEVGLSNTRGRMDFHARTGGGHYVGWQYQGGQMRLSVILDDDIDGPWRNRRAERERFVEQTFLDYFDFDVAESASRLLGEYSGRKKKWLGYEPDFIYRYKPVNPDVVVGDLVRLCVEFTGHALAYASSH